MALHAPYTTPYVRAHLAADPAMAMAVESLRRTTHVEGLLGLFSDGPKGRWLAIVNAPNSPSDGWRGTGPTVLDALKVALRLAEGPAA